MQYAKMHYELKELLHIACEISSFVYSAGFLLFFLFCFFNVQMANNILKHPFPLLGMGFFFFAERCKSGSSPYSQMNVYEYVRSNFSIFPQPIFTSTD